MSETLETPAIDKSAWGPGAWQDEPDRVDFVHEGFACMLHRHPRHGHWCGYVGVPREHAEYGKEYQSIVGAIEVHGDLTYSEKCSGHICHVPQPGMPDDVWWFGFDCGHCFDFSPGLESRLQRLKIPSRGGIPQSYRDLAYVRAETESLATQLRAAA